MKEKDQIQLLMEETGCEQSDAELALGLSNNDLEKAIIKIGSLLRYITAFKIKILFPNENVYGLIHIAINKKTVEILRFSMVFSYNPAIYEISTSMDWFSFEKAIFSTRLELGAMEDYTKKIEEPFKQYIQQTLKDTSKMPDAQLLKDFFNPTTIQTEIVSEELNLTQFKKLPDFDDKRNEISFINNDSGFVNLEIEIVEDMEGKPLKKLSEGDTVMSLITDERDIAHYLVHLIGGGRKDGNMTPIPAIVKKISFQNDDYEIYLQYTPSITGHTKVNKDKLIKVIESENKSWWKRLLPW